MKRLLYLLLTLGMGIGLGALVGLTSGCWPTVEVKPPVVNVPSLVKPEPKPEPKPDNEPKSVKELEKEVAAAKEAESKAHRVTEAKEKELADAKLRAQQHRLYVVIAFCGLAFVLCLAGAIYLRGLSKYFIYGCILSVAVAILAYFLAIILPYLLWIVVGLVSLGAVAAFVLWRFDHKALQQTVEAVEAFKDKMPGYKDHFTKFIDTDADAWLNRTRASLGLLPKK